MPTPTTSLRISESTLNRAKVLAAAQRQPLARWLVLLIEDTIDAMEGRTQQHTGAHAAAVLRQHTPVKPAPAEPAPVVRSPTPIAKAPTPVRSQDTSSVRAAAVVAGIDVEVRAELGRPLGGIIKRDLRHMLAEVFPDLTDLRSARAIGPAPWVNAGAGPGLIAVLFPNDREVVEQAKKAKNAVQMKRRLAVGSDLQRFISDKGIVGRGAVNFRSVMAQHFAGMSPTEAVQQGPEAWLDAGVGEDVARRLFDEPTAVEARRRATARGNAKKKRAA